MQRWLLALLAIPLLPAIASAQTGQVVEYYHTDAQGNIRVVTNQQGQVIARYDYLPFGELFNAPNPPTQKVLFTGKERDFETAMDYFGARFYRFDLGRFTTVDPGNASAALHDPQGWNAYAYARNNPFRYIDPDGRRWFARNGEAIWVEPNKDGTYTSPGEGWVEVGPTSTYNGRLNVAFVNGELSYIGETDKGGKMLTPFFREEPLQDTTFSMLGTLWMGGSIARAGASAALAARAPLAAELNFTKTTALHMAEEGRRVPLQILSEAIKHGTRMADPQGAPGAIKIVQQVFVNGRPRTLEIIYREADKTILHFVYK